MRASAYCESDVPLVLPPGWQHRQPMLVFYFMAPVGLHSVNPIKVDLRNTTLPSRGNATPGALQF
jgi:hypothetical protein